MRYALVAWCLGGGAFGPASEAPAETRVVAFGDPSDDAFAAEWAASRAHLQAAQFDSESVAPPREATRAELARRLAEEASGLVAVFWWVPTDAGLRLFAFDPKTGAYLRREIAIAEGEEAAAIESLALIIATTAEALRFGDAVAMSQASREELEAAEAQLDGEEARTDAPIKTDPAPDPAPTPTPTPEALVAPDATATGTQVEGWVSAHYLGEVIARDALWRSGVGMRLGLGPRPHLGLQLGYDFTPPLRFDLDPAQGSGQSTRHGIELLVAYRRVLHPRVELSVGGGPQLELWPWRANEVGGLHPHFRVLLEGTARLRLGGRWYLPCTFFSALSTSSLDFVVCADGSAQCSGSARSVVFSPFWVRGGVRVGLGARF